MLSTDLLQVSCQNLLSTGSLLPTGLLQAVLASCNKSANDKLQQANGAARTIIGGRIFIYVRSA